MLNLFKAYANKKQLYGFLTVKDDNFKKYTCVVIDPATGKTLAEIGSDGKDIEFFIDEVPSPANYNNSFKAILVNMFDLNLQSTEFRHTPMDKFCQRLQEKFNLLGLPSYFITENNYVYSTLLIATDPEVHFDENVVMINPRRTLFTVGEFKYTPSGYQLIQEKEVEIDFKSKPAILRQKLLGSLTPDKIIFAASACRKKFQHQKVFKGLNVVLFQCCLQCHREKFVIETCKWILDKTSTKYHIMPTSMMGVSMQGYFGSDNHILDVLEIKMGEPLPLARTAFCSKSVPELRSVIESKFGHVFQTKELPKDCHKLKVNVIIDESNLHHIIVYPGTFEHIEKLISTFDAEVESKIPVISFFDNSSVIACHEMNKGYQFVKEWNGVYGTDLFISFDQNKLQFGQPAFKAIKKRHTFVVFDLLKIMSMPSNDVKAEKHWGFWFTKNDENPVLLEFNTYAGCKKAASPSFLMAFLLRKHLKVLKAKIGHNPKKIGLCICEKFTDEEMVRVKEGLGKACELLKVDYVFVEADNFDSESGTQESVSDSS